MAAEDDDQIAIPSAQHPRRRHLFGLLAVLLVITLSLAWLAVRDNRQTVTPAKPAHLLFVDPTKYSLTFTNVSNKTLFKTAYPTSAYVNYQAVTPGGSTLLSLSISSQNEGYIFVKNNGKTQAVPDSAVKILRSAIVIDSSHQLFFTSEDTVVLVSCPSDGTCKLLSLNVLTGKSQTIVDTGAKMTGGLAPVYLLGLSSDYTQAYLRTIGSNKLSKSPGSLHQIDLKTGKVIKSIDVTQTIGYSLSLSPDKKWLVYKTGAYNAPTTIHLLDLKSYKDSTVKWTNGQITDQPSAFTWSSDSSKVLIKTLNIILPPGVTSPALATTIASAYLDISKMSITTLQTVKDPLHNDISYQGWIDTSNIVYQLSTSTQGPSSTNAATTVYKQNISSKQSSKLQSYGQLAHVIYW